MTRHRDNERKLGTSIKREQIMMIRSSKQKHHPDGTLDKYKARICCHGGQQQWCIDYRVKYTQLVTWSSVRIRMTEWTFQAYPQAEIIHRKYLFVS